MQFTTHFISHMVQMKLKTSKHKHFLNFDFISHMVQMKLKTSKHKHFLNFDFISHMVQMKLSPFNNKAPALWSLYPTWFRWNMI